jgi:hypothetical protein
MESGFRVARVGLGLGGFSERDRPFPRPEAGGVVEMEIA